MSLKKTVQFFKKQQKKNFLFLLSFKKNKEKFPKKTLKKD